MVVNASGNRRYYLAPNGTLTRYESPSHSVDFRFDGGIKRVHGNRFDIARDGNNSRVTRSFDGKLLVVSTGAEYGYVQSEVVKNQKSFIKRESVTPDGVSATVYLPATLNGQLVPVYAPDRYFPLPFYDWASNSWPTGVPYRWSPDASWLEGGYFVPRALYDSPYSWLSDRMMERILRDSYLAKPESEPTEITRPEVPLSVDTMDRLASEVRWRLTQEKIAADSPDQAAMVGSIDAAKGPLHLFIVSSNIGALSRSGEECTLSPGAVLELPTTAATLASLVDVRVVSSRANDCDPATLVELRWEELQEMNNVMRQKLYSGLDSLQQSANQGFPSPLKNAQETARFTETSSITAGEFNPAELVIRQEERSNHEEQQILEQVAKE
jgi:hypothetical protein